MAKTPAKTARSYAARLLKSAADDDDLLELRICDLPLEIEGSPVEPAVNQLHAELAARHIRLKPHVWLSDGWFTPDEVPGIAIPFYLAHPRLTELERAQMLDVEGGTHDWCMRILRHEAGHAVDNAYLLHKRAGYRNLFGRYADPYPESYRPKPYTKKYVVHLDMWYAQSHPAEDFAETFAVWLNPRSHWQRQYKDWPARRKLFFVDDTMRELRDTKPALLSRERLKPLRTLRMTLREHYEQKKNYYCRTHPRFYERDLRRIFSDDRTLKTGSAAAFLQSIRPETRALVSRWTGESQLTIDRAIADMISTVRKLHLRMRKPPEQAKVDVMMMLAVQTMNYLNDGRHRVIL